MTQANPFLFQPFFFNNFSFNPNLYFPMNHTNYININSGETYNIYETEDEIFIENILKFEALKISRIIPIKFERIMSNPNAITKIIKKKSKAFAIIGIIDLYKINYLGYVSSAEEVATIFGAKIYKINKIELIKLNNSEENANFLKIKENIKQYFSTNNLYYSIDYKIALPLSHFNENIITNNKYLINYNLLKPFFDNNIPYYFYCQIIFGFVSHEPNIFIGDNDLNRDLDMIIIERYINGNIIPHNDVLVYIKQIEFITIFKNKDDPKNYKFFSYVFYESNESIKNLNSFYPFKQTLVEELKKFNNIICILKNISVNEIIEKERLQKIMEPFNKNNMDNKIEIFSYFSNWKKNFFEDIKKLDTHLNFYSDKILQETTLWFININNNYFTHKKLFHCIIQIFWRIIQKQINHQVLKIDIGKYNPENTNLIFNRFSNFSNHYINNFENKKLLLKEYKNIFQKVSDNFLNIDNIRTKININLNEIMPNDENLNNITALCVTWNVGGSILPKDYELLELFSNNYFYFSGQSPDFVIISIQEIVPLNESNVNNDIYKTWTSRLEDSFNLIFQGKVYINICNPKLGGLYVMILMKKDLRSKMLFKGFSEYKIGKFSSKNNGFLIFTFKYNDKIFSIASGHLESGFNDNEIRIQTLKEILIKDITVESKIFNRFKDSDFWIILGDLNFRLNLSFEEAISLIQDKKYKDLYCMDQFHLAYEDKNNLFLKNIINEGEINFAPTYKFEKNSDDYDFNYEKKIAPSYCDRIFFCKKNGIKVLSYGKVSSLKLSDHRPVSAAFEFFWYKNEKDKNKEVKNDNDF